MYELILIYFSVHDSDSKIEFTFLGFYIMYIMNDRHNVFVHLIGYFLQAPLKNFNRNMFTILLALLTDSRTTAKSISSFVKFLYSFF